jgi:putative PIN family toxin of toxin-antitoxin system
MIARERVVIDTSALVSRLLLPASIPAQAVDRALVGCQLLVSDATLMELATVLGRPKFNAYVSIEERQQFLRLFGRVAERVPIVCIVRACRDPNDDKFLELAISGEARLIITSDADLLVLDPFQGIGIISPAEYLSR